MHTDINTDLNNYKYKSFISYSHSDEKWAKWLHKALEHYHVPPHLAGKANDIGIIPKRLHPVFRDRHELASATTEIEHSVGLANMCVDNLSEVSGN